MASISNLGRKLAMAGIGAAGVASVVGPATKEAAMDAAFGDPYADQTFLGSNLSARYMMGSATGGLLGGALQASAPMDMAKISPIAPSSGALIGTTGFGAAAGAIGGGILGKKLFGSSGLLTGAIGGTIGGITGLAASMSGVSAYTMANRNLFVSSPYGSRSAGTAAALHASGDIVLGMHNSRSGY